MEVSSTSMNVASVTVNATSQGLWLGRHEAVVWDCRVAAAMRP